MFYPSHCSLQTRCGQRRSGQVGSHRIRFCAYVGLACDEGVRHYRTTPGALNYVLGFRVVSDYRIKQPPHSPLLPV